MDKNKPIFNNINFGAIGILLLFIFYFIFDLGNIDALRQGTEGFYLQITKEMFNNKSFLTPLYNGHEHWSKPPLHFWLPFPFFYLFGGSSIFLARLSIAVFSFLSLLYIGKWNQREYKIPSLATFALFASSVCFFKYSRIYMMEAPLALLSAMASLKFFDFLKSNKNKDLLWASLLLALATLVKGPVAIVMCGGASFIYLCLDFYFLKNNNFKKFFYWMALSVIVASVWFILCYLKYGQHFIDYFFLRENLGKFASKSYPIRSVIQGLILYALPWTLFVPILIIKLSKNFKTFKFNSSNKNLTFLVIHFLFFFFLWIIPSQRSHHYAVPAIPFFLLLIINYAMPLKNQFLKFQKTILTIILIFIIILSGLITLSLFLSEVNSSISNLVLVAISLISLIIAAILFIKNRSIMGKSIASILTIGSFWLFFIPVFYIPVLPTAVKVSIGDTPLGVVIRKPYFVEESLGRKISILGHHQLISFMDKGNNLAIIHENHFIGQKLQNRYSIQKRWPIWERGNKYPDFLQAIKQGSLTPLQENLVLIKKK